MATTVETILFKIMGDSRSGQQALSSMQKRLAAFGASVTAASGAALVAFSKLGAGGAKIEALEMRFDRMATSFGQSAEDMLATWDKAAAGTIDRVTLMQKANQAALLGLPVDRLADMLGIARTAAESTGEDISYMFNSLVVGIARKSRAVLDNLGIIIDAEEAYASYAKTIGKAANALTAQEQQMAFMEAAFAAAGRQAQMLGENTETMSTIISRAKAKFKDAGDEVKKAFAPIVARAAAVVTKLLDVFLALPQPLKTGIAVILAVVAAVGAIVGPILTIVGLWPMIQAAIATVGGLLSTVAPYILAIVAVIGVLAGVVAVAKRAWEQDWGGIKTTVIKTIDKIRPYITMIVRNVQGWMQTIRMALKLIGQAVRELVEPALKRLSGAFQNNVGGIKTFLRFLNDVISVVMSTVVKILTAIRLVLTGNADKAWMPFKDAALNVIALIVLGWRKFGKKAVSHGWNLVVQLANGIVKAARTVLTQAANFVGRMLASFFAPGSPPKKGPLRGIVKWGKGLIDTYLKAFSLADFGILRDTLGPIREALQSAVDLGDMDQTTMLKTFRDVRQQAAALIADFRRTGQVNEDIMAGIAERLGEGGKEYTEYLRLTLEHQKALQNLSTIQQEVADAEARGFVPADLKAKLQAAEDEVDAKREAVDWQREYLASMQDGVDIQRELMETMKELVETIQASADAAAGKDGLSADGLAGAGAGISAPEIKFGGFGGFSQELQDVRDEVETFFEELPAKISEWLETAKKWTLKKLREWGAAALLWLLDRAMDIHEWGQKMLAKARRTLLLMRLVVLGQLLIWRQKIITWGLGILSTARTTLLMIGAIILAKLLIWRQNVIDKLLDIKTSIALWFTKLKIKVRQKVGEIGNWFRLQWLKVKIWFYKANLKMTTYGKDLLQGFKDGLQAKWKEIKDWWNGAIEILPEWARDILKIESPSKVMEQIGALAGEGLIVGWDKTVKRWQGSMLVSDIRGAAGRLGNSPIIVVQVGDLSLPGIRDGRDAGALLDELIRTASDRADLRGLVPGGLMT